MGPISMELEAAKHLHRRRSLIDPGGWKNPIGRLLQLLIVFTVRLCTHWRGAIARICGLFILRRDEMRSAASGG